MHALDASSCALTEGHQGAHIQRPADQQERLSVACVEAAPAAGADQQHDMQLLPQGTGQDGQGQAWWAEGRLAGERDNGEKRAACDVQSSGWCGGAG